MQDQVKLQHQLLSSQRFESNKWVFLLRTFHIRYISMWIFTVIYVSDMSQYRSSQANKRQRITTPQAEIDSTENDASSSCVLTQNAPNQREDDTTNNHQPQSIGMYCWIAIVLHIYIVYVNFDVVVFCMFIRCNYRIWWANFRIFIWKKCAKCATA